MLILILQLKQFIQLKHDSRDCLVNVLHPLFETQYFIRLFPKEMKNKNTYKKERNSMTKLSATNASMKESMINLIIHQTKSFKMGSNVSTGQNVLSTKKSTKQKKGQSEQSDKKHKTIRNSELMTSGRTKELKFKTKTKKSLDFQTQKYSSHQNINYIAEDCEQYCLVEDSFVPIMSKTEHQKLQDIMRSTADTTKRVDQFNRCTLRKMFPFQLKKSEKPVPKEDSQSQQSVAARSKRVSKRQAQVEASPFYTEIGIQYSQRPNFLKPIIEVIKQKKSIQVDIQTEDIMIEPAPITISHIKQLNQIIISQLPKEQHSKVTCAQIKQPILSPANKKQQTLSDLLLKLQFKHLPNDTSFTTLSKTQKQHYTDLLSSLISKLNCSPREKSPRQIKSKKEIEIEQVKLIPIEEIKVKHEKLQMEVFKRESMQMNWIQKRVERNLEKDSDDAIDTSLMAVNNFLLNFFCYVELNYMEDFLKNIRKQYGPSYIKEFQRVKRQINNNKPIMAEINNYKVLQTHMFEQFSLQLCPSSSYEQFHLQSIFDYTNQLLDTYRPYYQHHGQPFPWAVNLYNNICEYVIDQNSLEIIFVEIKQNIQKSVSMLCGLLVDEKFYKDIGSEKNPLTIVRDQKEKVMIDDWLKSKNDQNHDIECQATLVLNQVSENIYDRLLIEVLHEIKWL